MAGISKYYLAAIVILYFAAVCQAKTAGKRMILAISKTDHILAVVDPASLKIIARIPIGEDPTRLL